MEVTIDAVLEVVLRVTLCLFFLWVDRLQPFIRHIEEEELWLYRYPSIESVITKFELYILIITIPTVIFCIEYIITKKKEELINSMLALTLAYIMNGIFTSILKISIGRPRPNFFYRCFPDGVGMDINNCTGDYMSVMDARRSFPSGHSSFAFTGMFFITQHLFDLLDVVNTKTGKGYKFTICLLPLIVAMCVAISRTCDYHHHYSDVVGGAILGTAVSWTVYKTYYSSVTTEDEK